MWHGDLCWSAFAFPVVAEASAVKVQCHFTAVLLSRANRDVAGHQLEIEPAREGTADALRGRG